MLPVSLTESQENIPSLDEEQLQAIGMRNNHEWKLNATMLGFDPSLSLDDFIYESTNKRTQIATYLKGTQVVLFFFSSSSSSSLEYPIAIEGDFIIKEEHEMCNGEHQQHNLFFHEDGFLVLNALPEEEFTGHFSLLYGKRISMKSSSAKEEEDKEFATSCESITRTLKEIDQKNKELEFISTNNININNSSFKNERKIRIIRNSRDGSRVN